MKKLLLVSSGSIHIVNYYHLIRDYFDEVMLITDHLPEGFDLHHETVDFSIKNPLKAAANVRKIRKAIQEYQPTVIHTHQANSVAYLTIKANRGEFPLIVTAWGSDILVTPKQGMLKKKLVQKVLKSAPYFTSDSKFMADEMRKLVPGKKLDITIANFGINVAPEDHPKENLIYTNRLHQKLYRIDQIIQAFDEFVKDQTGWKLVIAGRGKETENLKGLVAELGLENAVEFPGWVQKEQNENFYNRARIFVSIPESDATSISLLEAMACGCIPVVRDLPANREWVNDGENGIIMHGEESGFLKRASELDFEKAKRLNLEIIEKHGTKEVNRKKFIQLYERVID